MDSVFDINDLANIKTQSSDYFSALLNNWKKIKNNSETIADIITISEPLGLEWLNKCSAIEDFLTEADSLFSSLMKELDTYIDETARNEQQAFYELDEFDFELEKLSNKSDGLLNTLNSIEGIDLKNVVVSNNNYSNAARVSDSAVETAMAAKVGKVSNVFADVLSDK